MLCNRQYVLQIELTLGQAISDFNNGLITWTELNFPLNEFSFRKLTV
jgi:hypothetical protein